MAPEGEGSTGGGSGAAGDGGAGAGADGASGAAGAGANGDGAASGAQGGQGSALAAGASGAAGSGDGGASGATQGAGSEQVAAVPEKYIVKDAAGNIDHAATSLKMAAGYDALSKRMGAGEAPPQTVDGYKINIPEELSKTIDASMLGQDKDFKEFLGKLHAKGASQQIVDIAVSELLSAGQQIRDAGPKPMQQAECEAALRQGDGWKSDSEYNKQVTVAFNAGKTIFGKDFESMLDSYGNDPRFIRGLAGIGREMMEDMPASPESQAQIAQNLDKLMANPAYLNANHPEHKLVRSQVDALTKQQAGQRHVNDGRSFSFKS